MCDKGVTGLETPYTPCTIKSNFGNLQSKTNKLKKVRPPGIEPGSLEWKSSMLPLYHERFVFKIFSSMVWPENIFISLPEKEIYLIVKFFR